MGAAWFSEANPRVVLCCALFSRLWSPSIISRSSPLQWMIATDPDPNSSTAYEDDPDPELSQLVALAKEISAKRGVSLHFMGNSAVILTPKTGGDETQELLEGPMALQYFMSAENSDCLLVVGSRHIHARAGRYQWWSSSSPCLKNIRN